MTLTKEHEKIVIPKIVFSLPHLPILRIPLPSIWESYLFFRKIRDRTEVECSGD